ncbi:hypothetical protein HY251_09995 [bacterium]|nr:hypothetical protein [bacterium]
MSVLGKSRDSLFELLGRSREKVLSSKPTIPPPGSLQRPGRPPCDAAPKPTARFAGAPVSTPVLERLVDDLLDVDGDPLLVVDDELDVESLTPEDAIVDEEPVKVLGVRADTAVVFGIGLVLVVAIAYFAGRSNKGRPSSPANESVAKASAEPAPLKAPLQAAAIPAPAPVLDVAAEEEPAKPAPAAQAAPPPPAPSKDGAFEMHVCTTTEKNATSVVSFLNESMKSPLQARAGLQAYVAKTGTKFQVRIRGFEREDPALLEQIQELHAQIPNVGHAGFPDASYHSSPKKKG